VLELGVIVEDVLLDFVSFPVQVFFVEVLEVVWDKSVLEIPVGVTTDQEREHDLDRSDDTTDVSE
jgi:hypothetical protein